MATNSEVNKHTIVICANILVKKEDKFLVIKRSPHKIIAPNITHTIGGKVDENEDPYLASQRELMEEAGILAQNIRLRGVVTEVKPNSIPNWQIFYFLGDYKKGELKQTEEGDLLWLTADEVKKSDLFPSFRKILDTILDDNQGPIFARFIYDDEDKLLDGNFNVLTK